MSHENVFQYATRHKLRFASAKGALSLEQLWDVPLLSSDGCNLDAIAKAANKAFKDATEESFVQKRTSTTTAVEMTLETVKAVIEVKLADEALAKKRADLRKERELILAAMAEKQAGELSDLKLSDLKKRLAAIESAETEA